MADWCLVLGTRPPIAYYQGARPADVDLARPRLIDVGTLAAGLRMDGSGGLNVSTSCTLDNGDAHLTTELADPPLGVAARLRRDGQELFVGLVTRVRLGATVEIDLEG